MLNSKKSSNFYFEVFDLFSPLLNGKSKLALRYFSIRTKDNSRTYKQVFQF